MKKISKIDRESYEPAYIQLVNILRDQIASGEFLSDQRLPSEFQLCKGYQVSPMTVRRAINILIDQGLIRTAQGQGTFVKENEPALYHQEYLIYDPSRPIVEAEMEVTILHGVFSGTGETGIKRGELSIEATVLDGEEARLLLSPPASPAFRLEHIFYDFNDRPVSWGFFLCRGDRLRFKATVGLPDRPRTES